jgi:F-type H+-transporting ATPase subunit k
MAGLQYYTIAGRQVASHHLAAGVLGIFFGGIFLSTRGGGSAPKYNAPPKIEASSSEEADFIKKFLEEADGKKSH